MAGGTRGRAALVVMLVAGTALAPLPAAGQVGAWTRQFGTRSFDRAEGVAVDGAGNAYVVGQTFGTLPGQASAGTLDAFVRTYDPAGTELWTRQFGSGGGEGATGVAVDGAGNAYVVGYTGGALPGQTSAGSFDAFVRKYDPAGIDRWTRQFGGSLVDEAFGVAIDGVGAYVVGSADGTLPGEGPAGRLDAFVRRYDPAGIDLWSRQFGSGERDAASGVAANRTGAAYVVGSTNGVLPGQTSAGGLDAFTVKLA